MALKQLFILGLVLLAACGGSTARGASDYALAVKFMQGDGVAQDQGKAMKYLLKAADEGDAHAELAIGYFYLKGNGGMTKDPAKALEYFLKAAKQGNRDAQYNVGLAYVRGEGVTKDFSKAYDWFEKAAYQDDIGAQYNLGVMAINGEGRTADPLVAYVWFTLTDEKGYAGAKEGIQASRAGMTEDQAKEIDHEYARISKKITKQPTTESVGSHAL